MGDRPPGLGPDVVNSPVTFLDGRRASTSAAAMWDFLFSSSASSPPPAQQGWYLRVLPRASFRSAVGAFASHSSAAGGPGASVVLKA